MPTMPGGRWPPLARAACYPRSMTVLSSRYPSRLFVRAVRSLPPAAAPRPPASRGVWTKFGHVDRRRRSGRRRDCAAPAVGHHERMTSRQSWHVAGPTVRDELAGWSDAALDDGHLGDIPGLSHRPPAGRTELILGSGVNVRCEPGPLGSTPAWYVHGLGGSSTDWTRLAAVLASRATGYSLDLPGSGRSDPPPAGRYSPSRSEEHTSELQSHLNLVCR